MLYMAIAVLVGCVVSGKLSSVWILVAGAQTHAHCSMILTYFSSAFSQAADRCIHAWLAAPSPAPQRYELPTQVQACAHLPTCTCAHPESARHNIYIYNVRNPCRHLQRVVRGCW